MSRVLRPSHRGVIREGGGGGVGEGEHPKEPESFKRNLVSDTKTKVCVSESQSPAADILLKHYGG